MMNLGPTLVAIGPTAGAADFAALAAALDAPTIESVLAATGTATVRRRKLPAEHAVWTVIGMALFRDRPIQSVVQHLDLVLPPSKWSAAAGSVTGSAVVQARDRLGAAPLAQLFERTASRWARAAADADRFRGLSVYGIDGTTLRIPDTPENEAAFGRPGTGRGAAGYPQLRLVALMVLRSHLLAGIALGDWSQGEITLAESLWDKVPDSSLTILDRGFLSYAALYRLHAAGSARHWLIRARADLKWRLVEPLGRNDERVEITLPRHLRRKDPSLPQTLLARAVRYQRRGFRPQILLTSLLDPNLYPAREIVALYHERWELELGFDEIKTHTLERQEALRSRAPERVRQEVWGLAIAYNLVRLHMRQAAARLGIAPVRISFRGALLELRDFWMAAWVISAGTLPRALERLHYHLSRLVLPPRRPRRYPRVVKIKMSNYPRKAPRLEPLST
jgi:hypothetical protein